MQAFLYFKQIRAFSWSLSNLLFFGTGRIDLTLASITDGKGERNLHLHKLSQTLVPLVSDSIWTPFQCQTD